MHAYGESTALLLCRYMPGYPKVDQESDYLIARYDGAVLDAKPWGRGAQEAVQNALMLGYTGQQEAILQQLLRKEASYFNLSNADTYIMSCRSCASTSASFIAVLGRAWQ